MLPTKIRFIWLSSFSLHANFFRPLTPSEPYCTSPKRKNIFYGITQQLSWNLQTTIKKNMYYLHSDFLFLFSKEHYQRKNCNLPFHFHHHHHLTYLPYFISLIFSHETWNTFFCCLILTATCGSSFIQKNCWRKFFFLSTCMLSLSWVVHVAWFRN